MNGLDDANASLPSCWSIRDWSKDSIRLVRALGHNLVRLILCFGAVASVAVAADAPRYRIASYNIRFENSTDNAVPGRSWASRRPLVADIIRKYDFDLFGTQEAEGRQIDQMQTDLPAFAHFGISREQDYADEHSTIFYKTAKFVLLQSGDFWMSTTPDEPSRSWDASFRMVTTWGKFRERASGWEFYVFNSHFDPSGPIAKQESAQLILRRIADIAGSSPVIFMGDLNTSQTSAPYATLKNSPAIDDAYDVAATRVTPGTPTFNSWNPSPTGSSRIDHVFVSSHFQVESHHVLTDTYEGRVPSDHYPVLVTITQSGAAPTITTHPASRTASPGSGATLSAAAAGPGTLAYQWSNDGAALMGATTASLTLPELHAHDAGSYVVKVTNAFGSNTSRAARLTVDTPAEGALINLSVRATAGQSGSPLIVGFFVGGGAKPILVRVVGPSLGAFGIGDALSNPTLKLYASNAREAGENDDWGGGAALREAFARVGAFAFAGDASRDAALLGMVDGSHSAHANSLTPTTAGGTVLVEVYDAGTGTQQRLTNISARSSIATGTRALAAGFVISGNSPRTLLVRGIGPALRAFGISSPVADPKLAIHDHTGAVIATNSDWFVEANASDVSAAAGRVGAFALAPESRDAALLITLPAGLFTVSLSAANSTMGPGLIEVYDVP